jgi:hypothetical protein
LAVVRLWYGLQNPRGTNFGAANNCFATFKIGCGDDRKIRAGAVDAAWMHRFVAHAGLLLFEFFYQTLQTSRQLDGKI